MIDTLKPYPQYKESNLAWLGRIPSHWQLERTKQLFRLRTTKAPAKNGLELLSIYTHIGVRPRKELEQRGNKASSTDGYWIVNAGDIIVNKLLAWMGAVGVSHYNGVTSPAYDVLKPVRSLEPDFYHHLFRTGTYLQQFKARSRGIMEMRLRLYFDQLGQIPVPFPPRDEQVAIVQFLNRINTRLDRVIRAKRKELALISEMLSVVTQNALQLEGTKRLRLSIVAEVMSRPIDRRTDRSYIPIGLYNRGRGIFHKATRDGAELGDSDFFWVEDGDFVISGQFAWEGAVALARAKESGCVASHRYPILRGRKEFVSSAVLFALFRTSYGAMLLDHNSRGAAGRNRPLNIERLLKETVPIPPISAQAHITELLNKEFAVTQSLAETIQFINEYRDRLIGEVVTGKLDVRGIELPALAEAEVVEDLVELEEMQTDEDAELIAEATNADN